jgi:hypothetical protein
MGFYTNSNGNDYLQRLGVPGFQVVPTVTPVMTPFQATLPKPEPRKVKSVAELRELLANDRKGHLRNLEAIREDLLGEASREISIIDYVRSSLAARRGYRKAVAEVDRRLGAELQRGIEFFQQAGRTQGQGFTPRGIAR